MRAFTVCLALVCVLLAACGPDDPYTRSLDPRLLELQREEAEEAAALYQQTLRRGAESGVSSTTHQRLLEEQRSDAEIKSMLYSETLRRMQSAPKR